jgi:CheY-like chemotaxis protein
MTNDRNDIVVVDDNPALLGVLSEIFKEHGYIVRTAADGFEALAVIRDREPDILVSDLNMPGMSGFELLSVVRRRFPAIAVIAMSGMYSDATPSPRVAADGFYAKGSTSAGGLLDILSKIEDEEVRRFRRAASSDLDTWTANSAGRPLKHGYRMSGMFARVLPSSPSCGRSAGRESLSTLLVSRTTGHREAIGRDG